MDLVKMILDEVGSRLHRLIVKIRDGEQLPPKWKDEIQIGDKLEYKNYGAITIFNAAYKVPAHIIFGHLLALTTRFEESNGDLVNGRSTIKFLGP